MRFSLTLLIAALLGSAHAACSPAQEQQNAQAVARSAAQSQLSRGMLPLKLLYRDITYSVQVSPAAINGNNASVAGTVVLRGTDRRTGKAAQGNYPGTVFLQRAAACNWKFSSYKRS